MNKTTLLFLSLLSFLSIGMSFVISPSVNEADATNIRGESYKTYVFSIEDHPSDTMDIAFTSNSDYSNPINRTTMTKINDYMFEVFVPSSITDSYVVFYGDNYECTVSYRNATSILSTFSRHGYVSGDFGNSFRYLQSSYTTRRMWFRLDHMSTNYYPVLFDNNGLRYIMNKIHNYIDGFDYYFVDVPVNISSFYIVEYLYDGSNTRISSNKFLVSSVETREVMYFDFDSLKEISNITMPGCDQYIVNEYLKGFSTCLDSSINGFGAFSSFIKPFVDNFVSYQGGTLSDVYQDDYLKSDYDNGYIDTSIRGGNTVSALDKFNALMSSSGHSRALFNLSVFDNTKVVVLSIILSVSILPIIGYIVVKHHKTI